ncbi:DNA polymerase III subunit delta' [Schnuerera sp. xch1]|uniref:DNA polymerase III subunit delta' n=1 Tax=Schnuerera sp. xch1 TaxID=2874283 RepID=UPI001CBEEDBF|nr:DNA polymerase III subunit delta' [Schnuerera sp. xch1]MBZ2175055.1 DNA polymerase III subunit delta' [Schnuerera sp. xch1]
MNFTEVIGHEKVIQALQRAIEHDHIFHCYLFEGEESIGKRLVALSFAKALLCKKEGIDPCNRCNSCLKFDNWNHPDLEFVEPEKGFIKKKKIDELIKSINMAPLESKRKIIIIDDSDKMGVEAQNALLKTLEEPPSYINIILITSNMNNLISTIVSRSQVIKFYPVKNERIVKILMDKYNKNLEEASFIAHFTKGSVGKSINLSQSEDFFTKREKIIDIIYSILKGDRLKVFESQEFFSNNKDFVDKILDMILYWFRDLIVYKEIGDSNLIINRDKIQLLSSQTSLDIDKINDIIDNIIETKQSIESNVNFQLAIETMLLNMQEV